MSDKPRLLLWSPLPPPAGGIASWTKRLLESELLDRYDVRVVNTNTGTLHQDDRLGRVKKMLRTLPEWRRALRDFRPDVVHVNTNAHWPGFVKEALAVRLARRAGARTVLHVRGAGLQFLWEHSRWEPVYRRMLGWADQVLVLNQTAADHAGQVGVDHVRRIPNFILRVAEPERDWPPKNRPLRLVFVGWMIRAKGIFELLDAMAAVPDVTAEFVGRWMVEGDGQTSEAAFTAKVEALGIADRVRIVGEVPMEEVWAAYNRADVFVLPSWTEGFPNTLLEAMMAGLPAVVTSVGAMPEAVVDGQTGAVVPKQDVDALTAAIAGLAGDRDQVVAQGQAARARALAEYERSAVVGRLVEIYDDLRVRGSQP